MKRTFERFLFTLVSLIGLIVATSISGVRQWICIAIAAVLALLAIAWRAE